MIHVAALLLLVSLQAPQTTGAVIRGRVVAGDTGAPIKRAVVTISGAKGGVQKSVETDDDGRFEFTALPADSYRLGAVPGATRGQYLALRYGGRDPMDAGTRIDVVEGQRVERADIVLPRSAVIVGRITDESGEPLARVPVYALQVRGGQPVRLSNLSDTTDDLGQFRLFGLMGSDYLVAADIRPGGATAGGESWGFVTTYHPGTPSRAEALRVRVKPGEEAAADIRLLRTRLLRISGVVLNRRGEPVPEASLTIVRRELTSQSAQGGTTVDADGRFAIANLPPGDYRLLVRDRSPANEAAAVKAFAAADVRLDAADVNDITLVTGPGTTVQGRLVFDPAEPPGAQVRMGAVPADRSSPMLGSSIGSMTDEETFVLPDVFGPALIRGEVVKPQGWTMKAVLLRGRDITDVPTEFTSADAGQVEIVFTARGARVDGRVLDARGTPAAGANVVIFGEDSSAWHARSSMFRMVGVAQDGTFSIAGLRPGKYLVAVVPPDRRFNVFDAGREVFEPLAADATALELREGDRKSVALRVEEAR
jgi:hypothetical protein